MQAYAILGYLHVCTIFDRSLLGSTNKGKIAQGDLETGSGRGDTLEVDEDKRESFLHFEASDISDDHGGQLRTSQ